MTIHNKERDKFARMVPATSRRIAATLLLTLLATLAGRYSYSQTLSSLQYRYMPQELQLLYASAFGDTSVISTLLSFGTDINVQADNGSTSLAYAVSFLQADAAEYLLLSGADPDIPNYRSETPLHLAIFNESLSLAELLIRNGANINAQDRNGATPLHYAALFGYFYEADMLLYYEARHDIKAYDGTTPLMAAVISGSFDIADILIQEGADVNSKDKEGYTPLLIAAQNGDTIMTELLLMNGADLYAVANDGYNALSISVRDGHPEMFRFLISKGNLWTGAPGVNPWHVFEQYRRKEFSGILSQYGIKKPVKDILPYLMAETSMLVSGYQVFTGLAVQGKETISGFGYSVGSYFKPFRSRVVIQNDNETFSQYIDRRGVIYGGVFKEFVVNDVNPLSIWLITISGKAGYKFGNKYPGSSLRPEHGFTFLPSVSLSLELKNTGISVGAEYMNTEVYRSGPIWFRAGFYYKYNTNNVKSKGKVIRWQ